jgi:hypothetical protein
VNSRHRPVGSPDAPTLGASAQSVKHPSSAPSSGIRGQVSYLLPEFHLFHIYSFGLSANDIDSGRIAYTVPMANENYFYDCSGHEGLMRGRILTIPPPTPPSFRILSLDIGSNLVLTSTGTNTWTVLPEFRPT